MHNFFLELLQGKYISHQGDYDIAIKIIQAMSLSKYTGEYTQQVQSFFNTYYTGEEVI